MTPAGDAAPQVDYLVVAPHPDDAELAMGGTILRMGDAGYAVGVLDLTSGEPTPYGTPEKRRAETEAATDILGLAVRENLGLPNRELEPTLDARRRVAEVYRRLRPRVLFIPYWNDAHPDHLAASALVTEARFHAKLTKTDMAGEPYYPPRVIYYFCTHLRCHADVAFVVDVGEQIDRKVRAMECYRSQFFDGRGEKAGQVLDYVRDTNRYWGRQINREYAEPFAVRETLGLDGFDDVI